MSSSQSIDQNVLRKGCHASIPGVTNEYGYIPSLAPAIVFCVLFGMSMMGHVVQSVRKRQWTSYVLSTGALVEVLGWAARGWSSHCPYNDDAFVMQITTLIIAPTFFSAGAYIILGRLIRLAGPSSSMLTPRAYLYVFCACDVVSLVVQAVGGGMASVAEKKNKDTKPGTNTMVAGILFQLGTMCIFVLLVADFFRRTRARTHTPAVRSVLFAMGLSVVVIFIRSIYRSIELLQGWRGYLITRQVYFIALDASMMVIAVAVYNFVDPASLLPARGVKSGSSDEMGEGFSAEGQSPSDSGSQHGRAEFEAKD